MGMAAITIPQLREQLKTMVEPGVHVPNKVSCTILDAPCTMHHPQCTKHYAPPAQTTIRQWMCAPHAGRKNAGRFLGLIEARVPHKINTKPIGGL